MIFCILIGLFLISYLPFIPIIWLITGNGFYISDIINEKLGSLYDSRYKEII